MGRLGPGSQLAWGLLGAGAAAWFAVWMLFFPQFVPTHFAWDVQPRFAQVFIGAGYVFRTAFFLNVAFEKNWLRLRWIVWGNLVFTGVLLFATYWNLREFVWNPTQSWVGHLWIVLYVFEPVVMLFLLPAGILRAAPPSTGGPVLLWTRRYLVLVTGTLLMFGLLPFMDWTFVEPRWPWQLNELDAQMISAWFLGWAAWCATMAFAADWDEIKTATRLFILNGLALTAVCAVFRNEMFVERGQSQAFTLGVAAMTVLMLGVYWIQERRRPRPGDDVDRVVDAGEAAATDSAR